jgi:TolA-binding protein
MFRKIHFVSVALFCLVFLQITSECFADTSSQLNQAKESIYVLIDAGKFAEAKSATDKLIADFNDNQGLPEAQYWIAERYERNSKFEDANRICQQITKNYPDSPFANKARLGISRAEAMSFVMSEKFDQAKAAVDKLSVDFAGNPDLPEAIYWIAERYQRISKFEEAKRNYQRIIQNHPDSAWANKARISISRMEAMAFVTMEKYDQAQNALDKMAVDFTGNTDLPGVLYWTTERFERQNKFEEAKSNYQKIAQSYPDSPYAGWARLGVSRANVMSLIVSGHYDEAKEALDKMSADFIGNPWLPETLYWITEKYEWADKLDEAKGVYQQIIQNHPDSPFASKAKLGVRRVDVMALMDLPDGNLAEEAINKMIVDFKDNAELSRDCYLGPGRSAGIAHPA